MTKLKVGIIGANGFIGKHLALSLINSNCFESLILYYKSHNNENSFNEENVSFKQINLKEKSSLKCKFNNLDFIYYFASETIPASSWENPTSEFENNVIPFINFMEEISRTNIKKIIFSSSAGTIYGASEKKINETFDKKPFNPYGISKLTIEYLLEYYRIKHNINYEIYRISNVYGFGQNTSKGLGLINTILEKSILSESISIYGDGSIIRNYVHINDVTAVLPMSLLNKTESSEIFNLCSNENLSINEIINITEKITKNPLKIKHLESRKSDNPKISLDNKKICEYYNDYKFIPIREGINMTLKKLLEYYQSDKSI
jgi:UDP-glucose 4-epimerase